MAGLGGIAESEAKDVKIKTIHEQRLHNTTVELGKPVVPTTLINQAAKLEGDTSAIIALAKTPIAVRRILDSFKGFITIDSKGSPTTHYDRLERAKKVLAELKVRKEHVETILKGLTEDYLKKYLETAGKNANKSAKAGKTDERDTYLGLGLGAASELAKRGLGNNIENEKKLLTSAAEGLNDTQKNDMLRAALQMGFSTSVVFSLAKPKGGAGPAEMPISTERDIMTQQLVRAAIETATRLNYELQRAKRDLESDDSQENRDRYEAAKIRLGNFLGSKASVDDLIELGSTETEIVTKAVMGHVGASYNLHTGQPSGVVPKKAPRRGMA